MDIIIPAFHLPPSLLRILIIVFSACFPFWLIFSWTYEITPEGIKKTKSVLAEHSIVAKTGNRLNYIIIACLVVVIGLLIRNTFFATAQDRKSTRLNSSHVAIAYAVLCLKK